jgi:uncharacterized membrane protein (DUF485 family)
MELSQKCKKNVQWIFMCSYACFTIYILFGILSYESEYIAHPAAPVYPKGDSSITA